MVDKQTKQLIESTVQVTIDRLNSITVIDKMKAIKDQAFKNTEQLLYNYQALKDHLKDEDAYFEMIHKSSSGSIVRYSKNKIEYNEDEALALRVKSYNRSKNDFARLEKALDKVKNKKGYSVIEIRYFQKRKDGETYSFDEIAEILSQKEGYPDTLSEKTVRRWRSSLVQEISINLFGSDAI